MPGRLRCGLWRGLHEHWWRRIWLCRLQNDRSRTSSIRRVSDHSFSFFDLPPLLRFSGSSTVVVSISASVASSMIGPIGGAGLGPVNSSTSMIWTSWSGAWSYRLIRLCCFWFDFDRHPCIDSSPLRQRSACKEFQLDWFVCILLGVSSGQSLESRNINEGIVMHNMYQITSDPSSLLFATTYDWKSDMLLKAYWSRARFLLAKLWHSAANAVLIASLIAVSTVPYDIMRSAFVITTSVLSLFTDLVDSLTRVLKLPSRSYPLRYNASINFVMTTLKRYLLIISSPSWFEFPAMRLSW